MGFHLLNEFVHSCHAVVFSNASDATKLYIQSLSTDAPTEASRIMYLYITLVSTCNVPHDDPENMSSIRSLTDFFRSVLHDETL